MSLITAIVKLFVFKTLRFYFGLFLLSTMRRYA